MYALDSPPVRPVICTSAGFEPHCSTGSWRGITAASSSSGLTIPTSKGTWKKPSHAFSMVFAGSVSTGMKGPKSAGRSDRITNLNGPKAICGRPTNWLPRDTSIATIAPTPSALPKRLLPSVRNAPIGFGGSPSPTTKPRSAEAEGRPFALRFQVPLGRTLVLNDLIKGPVEFSTDEIGDFVIVRPDGNPLYNFASVVDDAAMRITHVVRADEHLSNTFPQLLMFEALGEALPAFAHVPYVAEPGSKSKMSKRKTAEYEKSGILVYLHQYIDRGYLPDALLNYLARLGWSFDGTQEIFSAAELIEKFSLERVNSSAASHDQDKLFWIEGEWMKQLPLEDKVQGVLPFLKKEGLIDDAPSAIRASADRGRDHGAGRSAQGLCRCPQAGPVLLHRMRSSTTRMPSKNGCEKTAL